MLMEHGPSKRFCEDAAGHSAPETNWCDTMTRGGMAGHIQKIDTLWLILSSNRVLEVCASKNVGKNH